MLLAAALCRVAAERAPDTWEKLCRLVHGWRPGRAATLQESARAWLTGPKSPFPEEWEPRANQAKSEILEILLDAQRKGEIAITVVDGTRKRLLPPGVLVVERGTWDLRTYPFDLVHDRVECDGKSYAVTDVTFAADQCSTGAPPAKGQPKSGGPGSDLAERRREAIAEVLKRKRPGRGGDSHWTDFCKAVRKAGTGKENVAPGWSDETIEEDAKKIMSDR